MTDKEILFLTSLSISLPLIGGLYALINLNVKKIAIWPLVVCCCIGLGNEIFCYVSTNPLHFNFAANIYLLIEFVFMMIQIKLWHPKVQKREVYLFLFSAIAIWVVTTIWVGGIGVRNVPFTIMYYFVLILLFIKGINYQLFRGSDYRKTVVVISISMACFYTYGMMVEVFVMNYKLFSYQFILSIFYIKVIFNVIVNIVITYSLLCIPKKQKYLLSF